MISSVIDVTGTLLINVTYNFIKVKYIPSVIKKILRILFSNEPFEKISVRKKIDITRIIVISKII